MAYTLKVAVVSSVVVAYLAVFRPISPTQVVASGVVRQTSPNDCLKAFAEVKRLRIEIDRRANYGLRADNESFRSRYLESIEIAGSRQCWNEIGKKFVVEDADLAQYMEARRVFFLFNMESGGAIDGPVADNVVLPLNTPR